MDGAGGHQGGHEVVQRGRHAIGQALDQRGFEALGVVVEDPGDIGLGQFGRGIWGDAKRFREVYWSEVKGSYFTGDGCRQDKDGYFWIVGRIDDVLNVSGHRIGTAEVESALVSHQSVAEAAVVGRPDDVKGQALVAFVTVKSSVKATKELRAELRNHVGKEIGAVAKPDDIRFAEALPKTRSGKIMRRLLKEIAAGKTVQGDTTTLEDFNVIANLSKAEE